MLTNMEALELGKAFAQLVQERGLGTLSKKDYELLLFHHLTSSVAMRSDWNYALANKLRVTESRIKSMRLESSIRHRPANHKAVLAAIVQRVIDAMSRPEFSGDIISITLENPVERREFEYAVKLAKHTVDYGINREILRISALALFEVILANVDQAETRFRDIVQANITIKSRQAEILDKSLTFRQKVNKLGEQVSNSGGAVAMLTGAVGLL